MVTPTSLPKIATSSAYQGWLWIYAGYQLFKRSPLNWLAMCGVLVIGIIIITLLPVLFPVVLIVMPGVTAGLMLAAHTAQQGARIHIGYLLAGFSRQRNELLKLGVINLLAYVVVMIVASIVFPFVADPAAMETLRQLEAGAAPTPDMLPDLALLMLIIALLAIPQIMALWFSPALIIINKLKAWDAVKLSIQACNKNLLALLVYGLISVFFLLVITPLTFGVAFIVMIPVFFCSIYCSWHQVFGESPAAP